jgi:hypothetical protein
MTTNNGDNGGEWLTVGSKNRGNEGGGQAGKITGETDGSPMQVSAEMRENGNNRGRTNATSTNNTNEDDVMQSYNAKTVYIEVLFMTENSKVCNLARALKHLLEAAREQDDEFTILPLAGIGNNLCIGADVGKKGFDEACLGRWCWMQFVVKNNKSTSIVSVYAPHQPTGQNW